MIFCETIEGLEVVEEDEEDEDDEGEDDEEDEGGTNVEANAKGFFWGPEFDKKMPPNKLDIRWISPSTSQSFAHVKKHGALDDNDTNNVRSASQLSNKS